MTIDQAFNSSINYYDDWMRKALPNYEDIFKTAQDIISFESTTPIDVLDLHGNCLKKEKAPDGSKDENVFDIQQGVAVAFMIKK